MRWLHVVGLSAVTLGIGAFFLAGPRPSPERMHDWEPQPLIGTEPDPQPPIALAPTTDPPTSPLRDMTGVRARMVWVQDAGNGTDVFAGGADLRLMGLDTDDGLGERPILPDRANYVRPLLTSSGQQVVFSNRHTDRVWIVGWDGTGLRPLGRGMALAVWRDPLDGRDWVYVGTDRQEDAFGTLRRRRIDEPEVDETVWNQTLVGEELQVSRDGRHAVSVFPWPRVGLIELPNGTFTPLGAGCWAALAPDDSRRMWFLDNDHRNLTFIEGATGRSWQIDLSRAPGVDGYEIYHPRWSNQLPFLTMTGPYTEGRFWNRVRGGGAGVELYVGRFSANLSDVDEWVRVTDNARADFYPDLWLDLGTQPGVATDAP